MIIAASGKGCYLKPRNQEASIPRNKTHILLLAAAVALVTVGAKEESKNAEVVAIGSRYDISNGTAGFRGTILSEQGDGWYVIKTGTLIQSVNINSAFSIRKLKDVSSPEKLNQPSEPTAPTPPPG